MPTQVRQPTAEEIQAWIEHEKNDREAHALSPEEQDGLVRYVHEGIKPGSFLRAVIRNDLADACAHADYINRRKLFEYIEWLQLQAPAECWGSEERMNAWVAKFQVANDETRTQ